MIRRRSETPEPIRRTPSPPPSLPVPEPRVTPSPSGSPPDSPIMAPRPKRPKVKFTDTVTSERYYINLIEEEEVGYVTYVSKLIMPEANHKVANVIYASPVRDGLYIDLFARPHLASESSRYSASEAAILNAAGSADKHGSTHMCMFLKRLLAAGKVQMDTLVMLTPVTTVRTVHPVGPRLEHPESQRQLEAYYARLSFTPSPTSSREMQTTVAAILARCDDHSNPMQRVQFR